MGIQRYVLAAFIVQVSMWAFRGTYLSRNSPFHRIRVVGLDNFRSPEVEVVYVEAGIYHGGELLVGDKFTSEVPSTTYPRWNQWLVFDIPVKNLPKVGT